MRPESPVSAILVAWGNAWLSGHAGLDEAADHVEKISGPTVVGEVPLRAHLAELRADGLRELRLALPAPGDPLGLSGPPAFNSAAVDAGQAVIAVLADRCRGLVPSPDLRGSSYVGVRLTVHDSGPVRPDLPSVAEAEQQLAAAMRAATEALGSVDGPAQGRPDRLAHADGTLAPGYPARAHRVSALATRLAAVLRLADERGLTSGQIAVRGTALRDLDHAVRQAIVAAHHAIFEPVREP
ncbi:hypothetical protein [Nonomuraea cavernae]|uniref:Uncharacterized protein n=1 Tax=Nonomuraea cavernae TaxID=2045107 RepID=A0A917Z0S4_9ACTN|nr:hypothetical protein [Nonomuraea cavernae]MCA2186248.1 hypothetical protein [Nonomuraea cavernae]GGO69766.1 hypothetical protein GCM10012289_31640 [Nonomuraea cavernae]